MRITQIEDLDNASREEAFNALLACCGSTKWAQRMVEARPFGSTALLLETADRIWYELRPDDWLDAFAGHPRIGERRSAQNQSKQSDQWSKAEQAGMDTASTDVLTALVEANREYEAKFGYIFIVCATGKSSEEILSLCKLRLDNDYEAELHIAAEEQRKITAIRSRKLVGAV